LRFVDALDLGERGLRVEQTGYGHEGRL
jgi:hypothetical protein